jgi:hypothetical protein
MIFSKHLIIAEKEKMFRSDQIYGSDSLSNKGVVYAKFKKHDRIFHLFATHLQAWNSEKSQQVRSLELHSLAKFIEETPTEEGDGVILSGDLNINRYQNLLPYQKKQDNNWEWSDEYKNIRKNNVLHNFAWTNRLNSSNFDKYNQKHKLNLHCDDISDYTSSPFRKINIDTNTDTPISQWVLDNTLVGRDGQTKPYQMEWLDYILFQSLPFQHGKEINSLWKPDSSSFIWCHRFKSLEPIRMNYCCTYQTHDISDHYPVIACFRWPKSYFSI